MDFSQLAELLCFFNTADPSDFDDITDMLIADCLNPNSEEFPIKAIASKYEVTIREDAC